MKGSRAKGKTYERKVGRQLKRWGLPVASSVWFVFRDRNGLGAGELDHLLLFRTHAIILECKLTQRYNSHTQITELYRPLIEQHYNVPAVGVVVAKNLTTKPGDQLIEDLRDVLMETRRRIFIWHWLG